MVHLAKQPESQNTEWKQSWRDDYLAWICGFANAKGGKIYLHDLESAVIKDRKGSGDTLEGVDVPINVPKKIPLNDAKAAGQGQRVAPYRQLGGMDGGINGGKGIQSITQKGQIDTLDDTLEGLPDTLARYVLDALGENPSIRQSELAERFGVSMPTIKRAFKRLTDAGLIRRVGGKRFGCWEVDPDYLKRCRVE